MIRVLILLPCTGKVIAPFCSTFPLGFESGIHAAIMKFLAFGEEPGSVKIDIVDLGKNASPNDEMPVRPLIDAAERACNHFPIEDYDVLVSGTSPISSHLLKEVKVDSRFNGVHLLVSFDKDIVRSYSQNCVRLLPHYGIEFPLYIQEIKRVSPQRCVIAHVDDEHTTTSSYRFFKDIQKAYLKSVDGQTEIVPLPIHWSEATWNKRERSTIETIKGCDFLILSTYSEQLKRISTLCERIDEKHFPKEVLINLDGVDLLGKEVAMLAGLMRNSTTRVIAPECVLGGVQLPQACHDSGRVTVNWYDANLDKTDISLVQDDKFRNNYVAAFAFDSATAIIYSKQSKRSEGVSLRLTKPDLKAVLPFRGYTGQIALDDSGDLRTPLRLARIDPEAKKIAFLPVISHTSSATAPLSSSSGTFYRRIQEMVGLLSFSTRYLCFVDITHQDLHQGDKDLSWVVAAPTYSGIDAYERIIKGFGDKSHGYRIGNHPVVKALLPQVTSVSSVSENDLAVLPSGMPVFRVPETDADLSELFAFVRSNRHHSIWQIELVDCLHAELPRALNESGPFETELSALAFSAEETKFSKLAQSEIGSEEPPPLSRLWKEFSEEATKVRDHEKRLRSNAGFDLRKLYMVPVYLKPYGDQSNFHYAQSVEDLDRFRIAQIYLGIGWSHDSERIEAEREATLVTENIRSWLLEQSSKERIAKFERGVGVEQAIMAFGHQVKTLAGGISGDQKKWLFPLTALSKFCGSDDAVIETLLNGAEDNGLTCEVTPVPQLLESLGRSMSFWSLSHSRNALDIPETFVDNFAQLVSKSAEFAHSLRLASEFARKDMSNAGNLARLTRFPKIKIVADDGNSNRQCENIAERNQIYVVLHGLMSWRINGDMFRKNGSSDFEMDPHNKIFWQELAGLIRLFAIIIEGAIEYRPRRDADGKTPKAEIVFNVTQASKGGGRIRITARNSCRPMADRQQDGSRYLGMHGTQIREFLCDRFLGTLAPKMPIDVIDDDTCYTIALDINEPKWIRVGCGDE